MSQLISSKLISVQPLSAPSMGLYLDFKSGGATKKTKVKKSRYKTTKRGRPKMKIFKIKYKDTSGIVRSKLIKANSESEALTKIVNLAEHHYTIIEDGDTEPTPPGFLGTKKNQDDALEQWKTVTLGTIQQVYIPINITTTETIQSEGRSKR